MSGTSWTIQFAPQMESKIKEECKMRGWSFLPVPSCPGFATLQAASLNPGSDYPFIRRQWRHDFTWPGALHLEEFVTRASTGLIERFGKKMIPGSEITVTTAFRDRSHLGSRLRQLLIQEFETARTKLAALNEASITEARKPIPGLHVLLTSKALVASCSVASEAGVTESTFKAADKQTPPSRAAKKIRQALALSYRLGALPPAAFPNFIEANSALSPAFNLPQKPLVNQRWIDLGASPGGITEALFQLGGRIIAIDRAPLDARLLEIPEITFLQENAAEVSMNGIAHAAQSANAKMLDGIVCDMNGPPQIAAHAVVRLAPLLKSGGLVVFTLKLVDLNEWSNMIDAVKAILCHDGRLSQHSNGRQPKKRNHAQPGPFLYIGAYHLQQNRDELTLLFRCPVH